MENSAVATGLENVSFHSNPKERQCQRMFKLPHNCTHLTPSKVMLKILQVRLQQYVNSELPDVQAGFRKGKGTRDQIANIRWIIEKASEFQKNIYFCFIVCSKPFDCVDHNKRWKILQEMGIPDHLTCHLRNLYAGQEATEPDMKQWTGSKLGKEYIKVVCCHPCLFSLSSCKITSCKITSCKIPGYITHKLKSILPGGISTVSDMQIPL